MWRYICEICETRPACNGHVQVQVPAKEKGAPYAGLSIPTHPAIHKQTPGIAKLPTIPMIPQYDF